MYVAEKPRVSSRNALRAGAATFLLAMGVANIAEAKSVERDHDAKVAARHLAGRIASEKSVGIDANHSVVWDPPAGLNCYLEHRQPNPKKPARHLSCQTDVPLTATVDGRKRYFELKQYGKSLSTIHVKPIPTANIKLVPGPLTNIEPDNPLGRHERVATTHAVVELDSENKPMTGVIYEDPRLANALVLTRVGMTTSISDTKIIH
ncbi:MAG: hypothetical protein JWL89_303 [Candidatus Saccharibacteria bacterium]|nr:hypothetical protein [Candidatus Saccharibacteria bacterium]